MNLNLKISSVYNQIDKINNEYQNLITDGSINLARIGSTLDSCLWFNGYWFTGGKCKILVSWINENTKSDKKYIKRVLRNLQHEN